MRSFNFHIFYLSRVFLVSTKNIHTNPIGTMQFKENLKHKTTLTINQMAFRKWINERGVNSLTIASAPKTFCTPGIQYMYVTVYNREWMFISACHSSMGNNSICSRKQACNRHRKSISSANIL